MTPSRNGLPTKIKEAASPHEVKLTLVTTKSVFLTHSAQYFLLIEPIEIALSINLALPIFEVFVHIFLNMNLSLNQTLLTFLLYVRQTLITQLILAISVWDYLPLIRKDSVTLIYSFAIYVIGRNSFSTGVICRKLCSFSLMFSTDFTFIQCITSFFLLAITFFVFMQFFMLNYFI